MKLSNQGLSRLTKERIIQEYLSGAKTACMLNEEYGMSRNAINHMISCYKEKYLPYFDVKPILSPMKPKTNISEQQGKLAAEHQELRRQLQLAKLKLEGDEIMGNILEKQYGIDLLKKAVAKQSVISKKDTQK